jgi:hypothetical protein
MRAKKGKTEKKAKANKKLPFLTSAVRTCPHACLFLHKVLAARW